MLDLLEASGGVLVTDVLLDCAGEQDGLLGDNAEVASEVVQIVVLDVSAVDENRALVNLIKSQNQLKDG